MSVSRECQSGQYHHAAFEPDDDEFSTENDLCAGCDCPCHQFATLTTLEDLVRVLDDCWDLLGTDAGHYVADFALLRFINSSSVTDAFTKHERWYE